MYNVYTTQVEGVTIGFQDDLLVDGQALRWWRAGVHVLSPNLRKAEEFRDGL